MFRFQRLASATAVGALTASLMACGGTPPSPYGANTYPTNAAVATAPAAATQANYLEYGRVANIEVVQLGGAAPAPSSNGTAGTVIGGIVGGVLGNTVGHGGGRAAATVLGAVGGAVIGNRIARNNDGSYSSPTGNVYRVSVQTDRGEWRAYDVSSTGDLRVGDRVRIENNVLYRS